jgi:hypothetical protein
MAGVFVSYARLDKARVAPVVAAIESKGWTVWWDPDINPGQEFDDQIEAEITVALAVLVVWTPNSVTSRWVRGCTRTGGKTRAVMGRSDGLCGEHQDDETAFVDRPNDLAGVEGARHDIPRGYPA